jgi:hypothetical protein
MDGAQLTQWPYRTYNFRYSAWIEVTSVIGANGATQSIYYDSFNQRCGQMEVIVVYRKTVPAARAEGVTRHPGAGAAGYRGAAPAGNR